MTVQKYSKIWNGLKNCTKKKLEQCTYKFPRDKNSYNKKRLWKIYEKLIPEKYFRNKKPNGQIYEEKKIIISYSNI